MARNRQFGELELAVLNLLKKHGSLTVKQVQQMLGDDDHYTTVMTVMKRLNEKGQLDRRKVTNYFEYWIHEDAPEKELGLLERLKNKVFEGKASAMISYLIDSSEAISRDELIEIEKVIRKAKEESR